MKKALLVFPYKIRNIHEFEQIVARFEAEEYLIYIYDGITEANFSPDLLVQLVDKAMIENPDLEKIAVISNIRKMIFTWYRCYNSQVNDYICFLEEADNPWHFQSYIPAVYSILAEFNNMDQEVLDGKIYMNLNLSNFESVILFLLEKLNFRYFELLENYSYSGLNRKTTLKKVYRYHERDYLFHDEGKHDSGIRIIDLGEIKNKSVHLNKELLDNLNGYVYLIRYFVLFCYKEDNAKNILVNFFVRINAEFTLSKKEELYWDFIGYIQTHQIGFYQRCYLLSLISTLDITDKSFLKEVMKALIEDNDYLEYHFTILFNTIFYLDNCKKELYPEYYIDRDREMERILSGYDLRLKRSDERRKNTIAIFIDQLRLKSHSPTKLFFDYIFAIRKYYPGHEIQVFVEDNFACNDMECIIPRIYKSEFSQEFHLKHFEYLAEEKIQIHYTEPGMNKKERTIQLLEQVYHFNPETVLFMGCNCSLSRIYLYRDFPTVYLSMGGLVHSQFADICFCGDSKQVIAESLLYGLDMGDSVVEFEYGFEPTLPSKQFLRAEYLFTSDDFVMVSVGNRLDTELSNDYLEAICRFLVSKQEAKWLIVCPKDLSLLGKKHQDLLAQRKIVKLDYEEDLAGLYGLCDVYLNPDRSGGGYSIGVAMSQGLPILTLNKPSAARRFIGLENTSGNTMDEYMAELTRLFEDDAYCEVRSKIMMDRLKRFSFIKSVTQLMEGMKTAQSKYCIRKRILLMNKNN